MDDEPGKPIEIDEHHFREAADFCMSELDKYMSKQAKFAAWLKRHGREEESKA